MSDWLDNHDSTGIIFVQGLKKFFEDITLTIKNWQPIIFGCNDSEFWSADSFRLSHVETGGVTKGAWTFLFKISK
jgi:hypothetical protein